MAASSQFEKKTCFGETCLLTRRVINWAGAILATCGAGLDIAYASKSLFYARILYILTAIFIAFRFFIMFIVGQAYCYKYVINFKTAMRESD